MGLFSKSNTAQPEGGGIINKIASNFQANIIKWEPEEEDGTIVHKFEGLPQRLTTYSCPFYDGGVYQLRVFRRLT